MKNTLLIILILFSFYAKGQELIFGDSTIVKQIKAKTSWIYENKDETRFFLTKKSFYPIKAYGTYIDGHWENRGYMRNYFSYNLTKNLVLSTVFDSYASLNEHNNL